VARSVVLPQNNNRQYTGLPPDDASHPKRHLRADFPQLIDPKINVGEIEKFTPGPGPNDQVNIPVENAASGSALSGRF
jgi:hypothetical protein